MDGSNTRPTAEATARQRGAFAALRCLLIVLALARGAVALRPTMWAWSLSPMAYLPQTVVWALWGLSALALVPALSERLVPAFSRAGDWLTRTRVWGLLVCAIAGAALVLLLPNRLEFVGDFRLRLDAVKEVVTPSALYPGGPGQTLPADLLLFHDVPHWIYGFGVFGAVGAGRFLGALQAAGFAVLAVAFARALGLRGMAACAAATTVFFGGYLTLFTGYIKSFSAMCLVLAGVGTAGLSMVRNGRGHMSLGLALALGLLLHRMALGLVPAWALAWILWSRRRGERPRWTWPMLLVALALPILAVAAVLPRVLSTFSSYDLARNFAGLQGGPPETGVLSLTHLADVGNAILLASPLVAALSLLPFAAPAGERRWQEAWFLAILTLPFVLAELVFRPEMGIFRVWDFFVTCGVTVSLSVAWLLGESLRAAPRRFAWIGIAIVLAVVAPSLQWLAINADLGAGLRYVEKFALGPPPRSEAERASTWDFVGLTYGGLGRWDQAADALARSARSGPSPRILFAWAVAETKRGNLAGAQRIFGRYLEKEPNSVRGWWALGSVSWQLRDLPTSRQAATEVLRLDPGNTSARGVIAFVDSLERAKSERTER